MGHSNATEAEIVSRWNRRVSQFTVRRNRARALSFAVVAVSVGVVAAAYLLKANVRDWLLGTAVIAFLFLNALQIYVFRLHSFLKCPRCEGAPNERGEQILRTEVCGQCFARLR